MPTPAKPNGAGEEIGIPQLRERQVRLLDALARHCNEHEITYYVYYGTLLGSVRHAGWIPWDDDIDVAMPRPDFERFCGTFPTADSRAGPGYSLRSAHTDSQYGYPYAKLSDDQTILRTYSEVTTNLGIFVDIFPLDGWRDDRFGKLLQRCSYPIFSRLLRVKRLKTANVDNFAKHFALVVAKFVLRGIDARTISRIMTRLAMLGDFDRCNNVGTLVWNPDVVRRSAFATRIRVTFEGKEYWAPGDADTVLKQLYGDYLRLPPVSQRVSQHNFSAYLKTAPGGPPLEVAHTSPADRASL